MSGEPSTSFAIEDERLRMALEAAAMGTWEWDVVANTVEWSPTLELIHGLEPGTFAGTFEAYLRDIHPEDRERVVARIEQTLAGREHHVEYRIVRPDGSVRWVEGHGRMVRDEHRRPLRMLGVCMDVTARKLEELERTEMSAELGKVADFRERLLGIVAHDLRNPLAAITSSAALVRACGGLSSRQIDALDRIVRGGERMARIIGDLLDFTQARLGGGIPVRLEPMDMAAVAARIVEEFETTHPGREIALLTDGDTAGWWDPERAAQVLANLLANAVQHGKGAIDVAVIGGADGVVVRVVNGGSPIDPALLPDMFQPFARGVCERPGLGLGLYIVSDIVRAHGGTISVESTDLVGTRVIVRWPRSRPDQEPLSK